MIALLTGGSGCGKSTYAEKLVCALPGKERLYIATMSVCDEESVLRVARHRSQRAEKGFRTVECPKALGTVAVRRGSVVLLEDLVNLLANEMFGGGDCSRIEDDLRALAERSRHLVIVTNDVFSDGASYTGPTRAYLKVLAELNRAAAQMADYVAEIVYAIPVVLKGAAPCQL